MATIQEMLAYDTLMSGDLMRRGMAMGNVPPGKGGSPGQPYDAPKEDPANPYVPAPGKRKGNQELMVNRPKTREESAVELDEEDTAGDPSEFPRNEELMISKGFIKNVGDEMGVMDATEGMRIIDETETNPLKKELRRMRMFRSNPINPGLGGV